MALSFATMPCLKARKRRRFIHLQIFAGSVELSIDALNSGTLGRNGMIERFNGKIKKNVLRKYLFNDVDDLKEKLTEYINDYNFTIRLNGLGYKTPVDYLKINFGHSIQRIVI